MLAGLVWRLAPLHLPGFVYKYGGSVLYALMIYWLAAAIAPRMRVLPLAAAALGACFAVELFKLVHTPALDAFRLTLAGKLLLGRFFSVADLVAYAAAVCTMALFDRAPRKRMRL